MVMEGHENRQIPQHNDAQSENNSKRKTESSLFDVVCKKVLGGGQTSSDSGRQFWMPDSRAKTCYDCGATFNALRRRHHCRICGQVFCARCSPQMIDAKLYKACTGMDTPASVRVCKYCHRVTLRSEVAAATEHSLNQSTSPDRSVRSTSQQQQPQHFKNEASSSGSVKNSWFFNSTIGRRLSTSTSLASLGEMVRSTITPERKPSLTRPVSASSDHDRRLSLVNMTCDGPAPYDLISSSSYNNLRSLISEVHERIDYGCNKPNWVKEILEDAEQKQLEQLEQEQLENDIEFVKEFDKNDNHEYAFSDEEDEDLNDEQPDASTLVKFNSNAETISVRYSLTPTRPRDDCSAGKKLRPPPIDLNVQSLENSTGSTSESSSPYDLFRNMIPGEQSFFDDLEINAAPRLDMSSDSGTSPVPEDIALSLMSAIYDKHCNRILQQTLVDEKLSLDWLPVIADLSKRIASTIVLNHHSYLSSIDNYYMDSFDTRQGLRRHTVTTIKCGNTYFPMDIRQRVKIKCIQNGSKAECAIFNGVVFTKNVAHRRMRTDINNPKILLFACSIGYDERKRALATTTSTSAILKLTSFDSMRLQEPNYVANLVAKIASMEPQVIFVMGSVSSSALELLHEKYGITVVLNVKRQILERIALFTGTHLIYSPEILNQTRIGTCGRFRLQKFAVSKEVDYGTGQKCAPMTKTLMFVESCPEEAGCSVLLRGTARFAEFRQLKSVLGYMIYVQYNARLEKAFHLSLNCLPIEPNAHWKSMGEMLQYISRTRQRMSSARSRSIFQEEPHSVVSDISTHETELVAVKQPKTVTKLTAISDNSDPLRSSQNDPATNDVSPLSRSPKLNTVELTEIISTKFDQLLSAVPLSSSPGIEFPAPFLMEPNIHSKSSLRHYYPPNLLVSERLSQLTSLEIDKRASNSSEIYRNGNESFEKDDDYTNFVYLSEHYGQIKRDFPALADAVSRKEEAKLRPVEKLLESRYMVQKPHPLLLANEHARAFQNGRQLVSDFRSCGPYLRCIPTISLKTSKNGKAAANLPSEPAVEPLSSIDQERITVLFSVFSPQSKNAPNYCFKPHTLDIAYYGKNDMSLGAFLFRHFFFLRSRYNQPSGNLASDDSAYGSHLNTNLGSSVARRIFCSSETCSASMFRHLVRFSHHRGTITVLLNKIHDSRNIAMPHRILTWTFCVRCRAKSANSEMTPDALAFSFGKFLELKFYGDRHFNYNKYFDCASPCQHSLHKESYQFFSYDQLVVSFKYDPIVLYEVVTPAPIIATTRNQFSRQDLINYLQDLTVRGHEVYAKIGEELERIREVINVKVIGSQPNSQALNGVLSVLNLEAADLALIDDWASKLSTEESEFIAAIKEAHIRISTPELESTTTVVDHFRVQNRVIRAKKSVVEAVTFWNERINDFVAARKRNPDKLITSIMNRILTSDKQQQPDQKSQGDTLSSKSVDLDKPETEVGSSVSSIRPSLTNSQENLLDPSQPASKLTNITSKVISKVTPKNMTENGEGPTTSSSSTSSFAARFLSPRSNDEPYIALTNPFESSSLTRQYQMFEHYQLPTHKDVSIIVRDKDLGSIIAYALTTPEYDRKVADIAAQHKQAHFKRMSSVEGILSSDKESVDGAVNSTSAKVEQFDSTAASQKQQQASSSDLLQHIDVQYSDPFAKFYCCIYFAEQFRRLRALVLADGDTSNRATIRRLLPHSCAELVSTFSAEDLYLHSLANCIPWNAIGGKSGSTFSKTQNQRFILKEISKGELNHFITFACDYIAYCERALLEKNPSAFVKIIGVYQISYKNSCTSKASVHHIIVMENLFYECNISFIYDLKGSMRNRKVEINVPANGATDSDVCNSDDLLAHEETLRHIHDEAKLYQSNHAQTTTVLMDENLRQISTVYPLYVHGHSKKLLMEAIYRDSEFLRVHGVMDYSLLVGFDEQFAEYSVGIIDYVRLFNWEKEIEFRVKKIGKTIDPTIVHPSQYQRRFLDAINEYFVEVPDKWHPFMRLVPLAGTRVPQSPEEESQLNTNDPNTNNSASVSHIPTPDGM